MKVFFLLGAVAALDCSNEEYLTRTPNNGGARVVYGGALWQAQWSASDVPGKDVAWTQLGACDVLPPTPGCWPAYESASTYPNANTQVSQNGKNFFNRWYADPASGPETSTDGNWVFSQACGEDGGTPPLPSTSTSTTAPPTTATTTTAKPVVTSPPAVPTTTTVPTTRATTITTTVPTTITTTVATTPTTTTPSVAPPPGENQRPSGPVGPSGECVWPAWVPTAAYGNSFSYYVTHKGGVYSKNYYCDAGREPGVDACWSAKVASCSGEPPVIQLSADQLAGMVNPNGAKYQMFLDTWDPTSPTAAELEAEYRNAVSQMSTSQQRVIAALRALDTDSIEAIAPGRAANPDNVKRVERLVTEAKFNQLFPVRHPVYTYEGLLKAVGAFPAYCQTYTDGRDSEKICMNLLITSFAHNSQEVGGNIESLKYKDGNHNLEGGIHVHPESDAYFSEGEPIPLWKQALWWVREMGWTEDSTAQSGYRKCTPDGADSMMWAMNYQCPAGADYFGRGSKQLSWNYNYGMFSKLFFGDASYLLSHPDLVADSWLNFASGTWFAVTPQSPKPSMLEVIDGSWVPNSVDAASGISAGFGATINVINGGYECGKGTVGQQAQNRISAYKNLASFFGYSIPETEQLDCSKQQPFAQGGAGDMPMYWGNSWSVPYKCEPIGYQSAFLVGVPGDYENCVNYWWRARWVDRDTKQVVGQYGNIGNTATPPV